MISKVLSLIYVALNNKRQQSYIHNPNFNIYGYTLNTLFLAFNSMFNINSKFLYVKQKVKRHNFTYKRMTYSTE